MCVLTRMEMPSIVAKTQAFTLTKSRTWKVGLKIHFSL